LNGRVDVELEMSTSVLSFFDILLGNEMQDPRGFGLLNTILRHARGFGVLA
jgi:hypothetical protein